MYRKIGFSETGGISEGAPLTQNEEFEFFSHFFFPQNFFFDKFFGSGIFWNVCKNNVKIWAKKMFCSDFDENFFPYVWAHSKEKNPNYIFLIFSNFFKGFYFALLEFSETYTDPSLNEIESKLNFSSKLGVENLKLKFSWTKKIEKSENYFCTGFRTLRIFLHQKLNLATYGGGSAWFSLGMSQTMDDGSLASLVLLARNYQPTYFHKYFIHK